MSREQHADELIAPEGHQDCLEAIDDEIESHILIVEHDVEIEETATRWLTADESDLLELEECR
jgi:hypothetical protein